MPTILLLIGSNIFMTFAWYGHLKFLKDKPLLMTILISWSIALFEYALQVPANRLGAKVFTLGQLKIMQEIITMSVFAVFMVVVMNKSLSWNYLFAGLCMIAAAFFIFRDAGVSG